jgi:3-phosphoshikimate 1-carboxyvinyltransferase
MLRGFGYQVDSPVTGKVCLGGGGRLTATEIDVPSDISSAAFFMVGASIAEGSDIVLLHVGMNPTRTGVIDILRLMGADIAVYNEREVGGEPVADIRVRSAPLKGINIPEQLVPLAIDEFPSIFIAAACAKGQTVLTGAEELRVKESDRIQVMADGLKILGVPAEPTADGIIIEGGDGFSRGQIESHGDHRIAMSFAMASLRASDEIRINNCANVDTSFPDFAGIAGSAGLQLVVE